MMDVYVGAALRRAVLVVVIASIAGCIDGCAGLMVWQHGRYFRTELKSGINPDAIQHIGVYVFSNGPAQDADDVPYNVADVIDAMGALPVTIATIGTVGYADKKTAMFNIHRNFFPPEIERASTLQPHRSNAEASRELAQHIGEELSMRGFSPTIIDSLGHSGPVEVERCIQDGRSRGLDVVFIAYYTGLNKWKKLVDITSEVEFGGRRVTTIIIEPFQGFLYLTNGALFDVKTGERLWANSYYGLVEKAHLPNLESDPFIEVVPEAVVYNGEKTAAKAAAKAARILFYPDYWPGSFKKFPSRVEEWK